MSLDRQAKELIAAGRDVINLTAGQVDLPMPQSAKTAVARAADADCTGYIPATGSKDAVAAVREKTGWNDGTVLISAGAKPLLSAALACVCGPGDEVLLPVPCYTSYPEMIRLAGADPVTVAGDPNNRFAVSVEALSRRITPRTKALLLNNPVNPTGTVLRKDELAAIAAFVIENDLWLIADEVYDDFVYDEPFVSLYSIADAHARLILVNSVSKSYAMAGLRLGFAVMPDVVGAAVAGYLSHMFGCPCSLSERAAVETLQKDGAFSRTLCKEFRQRRDALYPLLASLPAIRVEKSAGAFYFWLDVRGTGMDDTAFCRALLEREGVALTPGSAFLVPGYVRFAYTKPFSQLSDAAGRIARFLKEAE